MLYRCERKIRSDMPTPAQACPQNLFISPLTHFSANPISNFMKEFSELESKLHVSFKNPDLLKQAFLHRSYLNEHAEIKMAHNERLEFLGDAVLELVVTNFLYAEFPDKPEGELTAFRASLVNTNTISDKAKELGFEDYLLLSKGEAKDTGKARAYILANTFEAFTGALYLDQGYDAAKKFIATFLLPEIKNIIKLIKK